MLTLPELELLRPASLDEAVRLLAEPGARRRIVAGGTDIVPNLKHGLYDLDGLVDITAIPGLDRVDRLPDGGLRLGALIRLSDLAEDALVQSSFPALAHAASQVAGPQLRNMGTLGGNVCLDTRCVFFNQTHFWRQSLGYCLKKDGTECHVVRGGQRCVAAQSSDTVPVLIALDAEAWLLSAAGSREVPVEALFRRDGVSHLTLAPGEVLVAIHLPRPRPRLQTAYEKLRVRQAIDFPALSVAVAASFEADERVAHLAVVGTALMATPRRVSGLDKLAVGQALTPDVIEAVAQRAYQQLVPLTNILVDPEWRREMVPVLVRRAFRELVPSSPHP